MVADSHVSRRGRWQSQSRTVSVLDGRTYLVAHHGADGCTLLKRVVLSVSPAGDAESAGDETMTMTTVLNRRDAVSRRSS